MTNSSTHQPDLLQERFGLKLAAHLSDGSDALPADIAQRLRHARMQAVAQRKRARVRTAELVAQSGSSAILGGTGRPGLWQRMGMVLPVVALLVGLVAIDRLLDEKAARDLARLDAALLVDDLPPAAYADPGFQQFLRLQGAATR